MRPEQLAEGVYLVPLQASNVYVWESDGLLSVVDTGLPGSADAILAAVDALGCTPEALTEILCYAARAALAVTTRPTRDRDWPGQ